MDGVRADFERRSYSRKRKIAGLTKLPTPEEVLDRPYVFVLSTGRSGTLLITKILEKSPHLRVEHNPKPALEFASSVVHRDNLNIQAQEIAVLASRFDLFFLDTFLRDRVYVETNNRITFFAPAIAKMLPNSKFIHLVRDPADFVRSGMRRGYYQEGLTQHQRLDGSKHPPWESFSQLEKIAWEWNEINSMIENFKSKIMSDRILTVNSERLYSEPTTTHAIYKFINIEDPYVSLKNSKLLKKLLSQPINKQSVGNFPRYFNWTDEDRIAFKRIVSLASRYGYSYE